MKKVLFGYIMNGKAGGIDKYMLNFFEHFSPGEVHFDFLTTQIDNELKEKLESKGAGLFEIPTLKNPRAQYKAICDIPHISIFLPRYAIRDPKRRMIAALKRLSYILTVRGMTVQTRKSARL